MLHKVTGVSPIFVYLKKEKKRDFQRNFLRYFQKISKELKKRNLIPNEFIKFSSPLEMGKKKARCT